MESDKFNVVTVDGMESVTEDILGNGDGVISEENRVNFSESWIESDKFNVVTLDGMESVTEGVLEDSNGVIFEGNCLNISS